MNNTRTDASCASYCGGECDPGGVTCWHGLKASKAGASYSKSLTSNGSAETGASGATGDWVDRLTQAMQGVAAAVGIIAILLAVASAVVGK